MRSLLFSEFDRIRISNQTHQWKFFEHFGHKFLQASQMNGDGAIDLIRTYVNSFIGDDVSYTCQIQYLSEDYFVWIILDY